MEPLAAADKKIIKRLKAAAEEEEKFSDKFVNPFIGHLLSWLALDDSEDLGIGSTNVERECVNVEQIFCSWALASPRKCAE